MTETVNITKTMPEILSPASFITFKTAINNGADAIYFGYGSLNARASADNFDDLSFVVKYCHVHNVKAYLALNIELKDNELQLAEEIIKKAELAKIDAFIIADLSLIELIRKNSKAAIHISTQVGIHNRWGLRLMEKLDVDRIVYSREVSYESLVDLQKEIKCESELFIHGALCVSFSGACLLSSFLTGDSGNRGRCKQLCRQLYTCEYKGKDINTGYLLSAKDINMYDSLDKLAKLNISSYKIEGRLKRAEYIGGITAHYKYNDYSNDEIKALFNRGDFTQGYLYDNNIIYDKVPNNIGIRIGQVTKLLNNNQAQITSDKPLNKNNGYKIIRNNREIGGLVVIDESKKIISSNKQLKIGDSIHITTDESLNNRIINTKKPINVSLKIKLKANNNPIIQYSIDNSAYYTYINKVINILEAKNQPLTNDNINDLFKYNNEFDIKYSIDELILDNIFIRKSDFNQIRRDIENLIIEYKLSLYNRKDYSRSNYKQYRFENIKKVVGDIAEVDSLPKAQKIMHHFKNIVYSPSSYNIEDLKKLYKEIKNDNNIILIKIPIFIPTKNEAFFEQIIQIFDGIYSNNISSIYVADFYSKYLVLGQNANVTNTKNIIIYNNITHILSPELNSNEIKNFTNPLIFTYGYLTLMYLNFCPYIANGLKCGSCSNDIYFKDSKGKYLIKNIHFDEYCEHELKNSELTDVGFKVTNVNRFFDFTNTDIKTINNVLINYDNIKYIPEKTNKLHLSRGVK